MTAINFNVCLNYVLVDEGGNDDDPNDHGGRTSRGITQREYDAWCKLNGKPGGDVWQASAADVKEIYHDQYWLPYSDDLPSGLDYVYFDTCVNAGRVQAVKSFQKALGVVSIDGMMGQVTLAAIKDYPDSLKLIHLVCEVRRDFYRNLAQFPRYGKGWLSRVDHCEHGATMLATNVTDYAKPPATEPTIKASEKDPVETTISPETGAATAAGSGGVMAVVNEAQQQLQQFGGTFRVIQIALVVLSAIGIGFMVYGLIRRSRVKAALNT